MQEAFFIVGPTAVGKTSVAVALAEEFGAEIVSADAFQVYKGFDLLTAKPSAEQRYRVPHHLVGCVPVTEVSNVALYLEAARRCLEDLSRRGSPAIVVGGSGLYVKALTHGLAPLPAADAVLRRELDAASSMDLLARLQTLDPATAAVIDVHNKRRVMRALEVCLVTGRAFSSFRQEWVPPALPSSPQGLFMFRDRPDLVSRIEARLTEMFARGVLEEVRVSPLPASGASQILGWRQIQDHLAGHLTLPACREQILIASRQYAKRQMTWFKRETCFECLNASKHSPDDVLAAVRCSYLAWRSVHVES